MAKCVVLSISGTQRIRPEFDRRTLTVPSTQAERGPLNALPALTVGVPSVIVLLSDVTKVVLLVATIRLVCNRPDSNCRCGGPSVAKAEVPVPASRPCLRNVRTG